MFSLVLLVVAPWLVLCMPPPTTTPTASPTTPPETTTPLTTAPPLCICLNGTPVPPGETVWITNCHGCYCDEYSLEAQEIIADCFMTPCVDSVNIPGQCCPNCPNGENCLAEFIDFNGTARSEIISANGGVVDFGAALCQCDYQYYNEEPRASCVQITTTPPPTTTPAMCTCPDGIQISPGQTHSISDCHSCYCDEYSLQAQEMIADCFIVPCVDSVNIPGQCCPNCPNGENCLAEFIDFNGTARSEIISAKGGVVDFGAAQCQCDYHNYIGEPRASCVQITTTPPPTTTPAMCTCPDGTQISPGETHSISDCHSCYCDEHSLQAQEMIADCFIVPCVDSVNIPGQCCPNCPNGENCLAEFIDFNGTARSEIISANGGVVDFGAAQCQCDYQYYNEEPRASCVQIKTTPPPTTTPAMCRCSDGTPVAPGESIWITACHGCYCDEYNLEAYEMVMDCFWTPCVDSVSEPGQCCPQCPNGENCLAEFIDFDGTARSEIISANGGVVDFGAAQCQCDYQNYFGEPRASCVPMTTTQPPTTTPAMCTCSDGIQISPGQTHSISDCHSCYCDEYSLQAQEMIADCFIVPCVDSVNIPGQCCPNCPNGENCLAEFIDFNGTARSEIISANGGAVDFGAAQCQCDYQNYYGEPRASCVQITTTPLPTTTRAICTCSDGTKVEPGETVWITDCHGCYCDENSLQPSEMIADCFMTPCVDSVNIAGQCCSNCPNGDNCRAEFIDDNGVARSEIIKFSDGVIKFNSTECQCDYQNYNGEPKAVCVHEMP